MPFPEHAYGSPAIRGARDIEYDAFSRVTRLLMQAPRKCADGTTIAAVSRNSELWTILASDLAQPENALDTQIRAGLLSLAQFALKHGQKVLAGQASTDVLIEINMAVMKGLRGAGAA